MAQIDPRVWRLRFGNPGILTAVNPNRPISIGDAVSHVEMLAPRFDELLDQVTNTQPQSRFRRRLAGEVPGIAPFFPVEDGVSRDLVGHFGEVLFENALAERLSRRLPPSIENCPDPAAEHF